MAIYSRIISVAFIAQTNTKPHRYVIRAAGFPKSIVSITKYDNEEDAVREYVENIMPKHSASAVQRIDFISATRYCNPMDEHVPLYFVKYNEVYK